MTKFRSILSFATISALCLGLVACGSNDAEKSTVEDISIIRKIPLLVAM